MKYSVENAWHRFIFALSLVIVVASWTFALTHVFDDHCKSPKTLPEQNVIHADDFNKVFVECQEKNEASGRIYPLLYTFIDGTLFDPRQVIENIRQCGGFP